MGAQSPWAPYGLALDGLPEDVARLGWDLLSRLQLTEGAYRLPLLTSAFFSGLVSGSVDLLFKFPTTGIIFGVSQSVEVTAPDTIVDLQLAIRDASSARNLIGTEVTPFSLTGIPDAQTSGTDQLRLSPMACNSTTQWAGKMAVVSGVIGATRGVVNLLGIGFWDQGSQITGVPAPRVHSRA